MTIKFEYTDEHYEEYQFGARVVVATQAEHIKAVVDAFKTFLTHVGYHPELVENVSYDEPQRAGFKSTYGDGNPSQGDFFGRPSEAS